MINKYIIVLLMLTASTYMPVICKADGEPAQAQGGVNPASNAGFDKRLPPVLPGEELKDGHGKSKIWSTSGPVNVGEAPAVPTLPGSGYNYNQNQALGGVIVDDRSYKNRNH